MSTTWDHFWYARVAPHALALTRIALAFYVLLYTLLYAPHVTFLFSNQGITLPLYLAPASEAVATTLFCLVIVAALGVLFGAWYRISMALLIVLGLYFWQLQLHLFPTSYNRILLFTCVVLLFSGAGKVLSFDQYRRRGSIWAWEEVSILPQRLIALQISITFLGVSLQKWWLPQWQGGEVLIYSFLGMWATPLAEWYARLPLDISHYDYLVWFVKIGQPIAAVGLWFRRTRFLSWLFISWFILMVSFMLSIWWFIYIIPACILFLRPQDVKEFLEKKERIFGLH